MNVDPIEFHSLRGVHPRGAQEIDAVSPRDDATEDLPEVKLSAARLRILVVLPVEDEYPH
jgi:hypothetical protein